MKRQIITGLAALSLGLTTNIVGAVDYYLCADTTTVTMPDSSVVPMWGFALDDNANLIDGCGTGVVTVPGPEISVPAGDFVLNIHLRNDIQTESVSVVIPGQPGAMTPVFFTDASGRQRVRSFTRETLPNTLSTYSWMDMQPGTYLYHSGTHPQVQVQMGLYGAVVKPDVSGNPYAGVVVDNEITLLYSEIDPELHAAVDGGTYTACTGGFAACQADEAAGFMPSTIDFQPKWFLVNGEPFTDKLQASHWVGTIPGLAGSYEVLLRFLNAGIQTHSPLIQNARWKVIAENGRPYSFAKDQYTLPLPALNTRDVVLTVADFDTPKSFAVYDRRLKLTNNGSAFAVGGMISFLMVDDDNDADGVPNFGDNCVEVPNGPLANNDLGGVIQRDSDSDGFGNLCDGDLNNDYQNPLNEVVNFLDLGTFSAVFFTADADADFDGSGLVDFLDLGLFNTMFFNPPGPSCVIPDADPILCPLL